MSEATIIERSATATALMITVDRTDKDPEPGFHCGVDVAVKVASVADIDAVLASKAWVHRLAGLFIDLVRLAREDERLAELMTDRYNVRVQHGDVTLWPPGKQAGP